MRFDPFSRHTIASEEVPPIPSGTSWYRRLFSVHEIESNPVLKWFLGALLLGYYVTFSGWSHAPVITVEHAREGQHHCWPYFLECGDLYFLSNLPDGYSQATFYMAFFVLIALSVFAIWKGRWVLAHALMLPMFLWKALVVFVLTRDLAGNYHYYHLVLSFLFLFAPHKLFFLRRTFVALYLLAATVKIHAGWIAGTYFSSLTTGLPLVPDALIPIFTNAVIVLESFVSWLLLSRRYLVQRLALVAFVVFHVYSGFLVEYLYPTMCLPPLLVLFGPAIERSSFRFSWRHAVGCLTIAFLFSVQSLRFVISENYLMTMEGNFYGLYMFEANHQCVSTATIAMADGREVPYRWQSVQAIERCDPFKEWFRFRQLCRRKSPGVARIRWTYDHSINGGPLYRIVDVADACALDYAPLRHNAWIRTPSEGAPAVGQVQKNVFSF